MFNLYNETIVAQNTSTVHRDVKDSQGDKGSSLTTNASSGKKDGDNISSYQGIKSSRTKQEVKEDNVKLPGGGEYTSGHGATTSLKSGSESPPAPPSPSTYREKRAEVLRHQESNDGINMDSFDYLTSVVPGALRVPAAGRTTTSAATAPSFCPTTGTSTRTMETATSLSPTTASISSGRTHATTFHSVEEGTISATLVSEDEADKEAELTEKILKKITVSAEAAEVVQSPTSKKKWIYVGVGFCLLVAVVVGATIGVTLSSSSSTSSGSDQDEPEQVSSSGDDSENSENNPSSTAPPRTATPSAAPTPISDEDKLMDLVLPISRIESFDDEESAAYKAFQWMIFDDMSGIDFGNTASGLVIERYAMAVIYFSTGGPDWVYQYDFLNNASICDWPYAEESEEGDVHVLGVSCNEDGRVVKLQLRNNNLNGTIPSEIMGLEQLEYLDWEMNSLSGTIPSTIGSLSQLQFLYLTMNELTGNLPLELAELSTLDSLHIWANLFSGTIPEAMTKQTHLQDLVLARNMFEGIIPDFGTRMELGLFDLGDNFLTGSIPSSLFDLNNLKWIILSDNELTGGIDSGFGKITSLKSIYIENNMLGGTIPDLSDLLNLEGLELGGNQLTGSIPSSWLPGQKLWWVRLNNNFLSGTIPSELGHLTGLWNLDIQSNLISGQVPLELSQLTNLGVLRLQDNDITGSLGTGLCSRTLGYFVLEADCLQPEVTCPCCTTCCDASKCISDAVGVCERYASALVSDECHCEEQPTDNTVQLICEGGTCTSCDATGDTCVRSRDHGQIFDEFGVIIGYKTLVRYVQTQGRNERMDYTRMYDSIFCSFAINGNECRSCVITWSCPDGTNAHFVDCRNIDDYGVYDGCSQDYGHEVFEALHMRETNSFYPEDCWYFYY